MCRLIGFAAPRPATLTELVGTEQVARFRDMGRVHRDGWGTAWLDNGLRTYRATGLPDDAEFAALAEAPPSGARLVHLRWATEGLEVSERNTHPFVADGLALAHNGSISPRSGLDELLKPELQDSLVGTTDSERYLALVRQELAVGGDLSQAVARAVATLRHEFPLASLNALVLAQGVLIAVHASLDSDAPLDEMRSRGIRDEDLPLGHVDEYFRMYWRRGPRGSVLFSSSGLVNDGWQPLPPESVTTVELATMRVSHTQLVPRRPGADQR
jgi:gamma-glutamyl hercynylcysteine S-oxide hydrolase